ncbi:MAG: NAD(P)H-hydrate dehydratase [Bacteroidetes bacterium]|nr:NAD(P)H-hydrate dehydratase [Bacteroidota bacterium]MCY4205869.1 NAD(P)H-hydrate dehydratase [Bacteroidota bacterium]
MESQVRDRITPDPDPIYAGFLPLLCSNVQQKFDQLAIEKFGFSSMTLMENAGRSSVFIIEREFGPMRGRKVVIYCGSGNNGGDGYVVARTLYNHGAHVCVIPLKPPSTPDAAKNFAFLQKLETLETSGRLELIQDAHNSPPAADLYIDALFGVGLSRPLQGRVANLVDEINESASPVVAIDLPSGLHADTGIPFGKAVHADLTITFSAYKPGLLFGQSSEYSGQVELVHIGLPLSAILNDSYPVHWISTDTAISAALPSRDVHAHKYSAGMVLVIGGSTEFSGAPILAARAAARAGAGYVACAVPESIQPTLATSMTEIPSIGLAQSPEGGIEAEAALQALQPWLTKADALVIGPGLGKNLRTQNFVRSILLKSTIPMVIDADALTIAVELLNTTSKQERNWILTPHAGEFKRMVGDLEHSDKLDSARHWSSKWNCTLVLKGSPTIISDAQSNVVVCGRGNAALATAGTGDVLAGLCGSMVAQGCTPSTASIYAAHIGGLAADLYADTAHPATMIAGDLIDEIVAALTHLKKT